MFIYRIRSKKTGLYSKGGTMPSFSKNGKVWNRRSHINSHFTQLHKIGKETYIEHDVEVLEYELTEVQLSVTSGSDWLNASVERAAEREAESKARRAAWVNEYELRQLKELQLKHPGAV